MFDNLFPDETPQPVPVAILELQREKWWEVRGQRRRSASGLYNFVSIDGIIYLCKSSRVFHGSPIGHIDIARGRPVDYAGQIQFSGRKKRGHLRFWDNVSGHYRPSADKASQAGLPMNLFRAGNFR